MYRAKLQEKLKQQCKINPENDCWEWQGQIANSGRGRVMIRDEKTASNKTVSAEDASYIAFIGDIPENAIVRQTCNNRLCINPAHLELMQL